MEESTNISSQAIVAQEVLEGAKMGFLPKHFGANMINVEATIFSYMRALCKQYQGGMWDFFEVSNGSAFMAPRYDSPLEIAWSDNGYHGFVSAEAAGIIATLFALNHLLYVANESSAGYWADKCCVLLDYAYTHPESAQIVAAID